jgi:endonuclease/exonuclease/phosphatase family metal-dependent hydrolase
MPKSLFRRISKKFFIITNIIVAAFFLVGCYNKIFFSALRWPVGLLSMSAFYLLLVLCIFTVFWLFARPGWMAISIIAIAIAYKPIQHIIPFRFAASFSMAKQRGDIRIMSWNVAQFDILYNKQRPDIRDDMITVINEYKPDIACFQEMVAGDTLVNLNTAYYKKYSFFSVFEYAHKLSMPEYFFSYNFKEDFLNHQHFGLMIFSKYPIINRQTVGSFPFNYNNNFQYVDIVKGADTFRVFNIHLQSLKFTPVNLQYIDNPSLENRQDLSRSKSVLTKFKSGFLKRQLQANKIKATIDESPYPVIVCGDLNDVPNSYAYQKIGDGLQNAFVEAGAGLGRTFSGIAPTLRIDNIFMQPSFVIHQYARVQKKLSDHFPIIADMSVK